MGSASHPALDYGEIALELINDLFIEERYAEARALLPTVDRLNPTDDSVRPRFEASLCIMEGQVDEGLRRFQEMIDANEEDPAFVLTIGLDLISCARFADALEVLEKAHETALREYADEEEMLDEIARAREYAREMLQARN
jgi:Flp pilus assembly protein TadD